MPAGVTVMGRGEEDEEEQLSFDRISWTVGDRLCRKKESEGVKE